MIGTNYHTERKYKGKGIIIDIAAIGNRYEVMTLYAGTGRELAVKTCDTLPEAVQAYEEMLDAYPESAAPLTGKYAALRDDLKAAMESARNAAAAVPHDSGTCNMDAAALHLPRWKSELVRQAAEEAGTHASDWTLFGKRYYVFHTPRVGQALKNEVAAEAMTAALASKGYDAFNYCQAD